MTPTALTTPTVTVGLSLMLNSPNGLPKAITHSPVMTSSELPSEMNGRFAPSIFSRAMSDTGSVPISFAEYFSPFVIETVISFAFPATWSFVRMYPSAEIRNPDPSCGTRSV